MIFPFIIAGFCFGMGMWNCRQPEGFYAGLAGIWFAAAAMNIYFILEA